MLKGDVLTRNFIAEAISTVANNVVRQHVGSLTQEPQLTSRIAQALETSLNGLLVNNYSLQVVAQEFPDRGPKALEKETGIDLYVGLQVQNSASKISKGIIIQSKWDNLSSTLEKQKLDGQCQDMLRYSKSGSFVWLYGSSGISVIPASEVIANPQIKPQYLGSRNLYEIFVDILDCFKGDKNLAREEAFYDRKALSDFLSEFRISSGVNISIKDIQDVNH